MNVVVVVIITRCVRSRKEEGDCAAYTQMTYCNREIDNLNNTPSEIILKNHVHLTTKNTINQQYSTTINHMHL